MRIWIARHGDKERGDFFNPALGHDDQPLSALGREQAGRLAAFLADKGIRAARISRYRRTAETAAPFLAASGLAATVDARLDEIDTGDFYRLGEVGTFALYPDFRAAWEAKDRDFAYPGGESGADVLARIRPLLAELAAAGEDTLLVTHEGWTKLAMCELLGLPPERRFRLRVDTCGVMEVEMPAGPGRPVVGRFNHVPC